MQEFAKVTLFKDLDIFISIGQWKFDWMKRVYTFAFNLFIIQVAINMLILALQDIFWTVPWSWQSLYNYIRRV